MMPRRGKRRMPRRTDKKDDKKDDDKKDDKKEAEKKDDAKVQLSSESDPICHSAGCTQYPHPKPSKEGQYPMDYFVPNFGQDRDVVSTWNSLDVAESIKQHRWEFDASKLPKPEEPVVYKNDEDLDSDIDMTNEHMAEAEKKLGKWDYKALQTEEDIYQDNQLKELQRQHKTVNGPLPNYNSPIALAKLTSDPIFGTGDQPEEHDAAGPNGEKIVVYPDPDVQGLDEDIKLTQNNIKSSQDYWKHSWKYNVTGNMPNFAIPGKPEFQVKSRLLETQLEIQRYR